MILQYYLSIYAINFFTSPTFSVTFKNFKVRLINQQNGDCNDSSMLNVQLLSASTFPVQIKLKGSERLLMKVKIIAFKTQKVEIVIGEGVVNIDKNTIQNSIRVPIYDKKQGVEEVAICSVDFFVSGNHISKNVSIALDKSKSKIQDWRDQTEDAVYSQMSYTVQSENEHIQVGTLPKKIINKDNRQIESANKKDINAQSQHANSRSLVQGRKSNTSNQKNNYKKVEYPLQPQSPLQNSACLSQAPSKKHSIKKETVPQSKQKQTKKQMIQQSQKKAPINILAENSYTIDENKQQDETINAQVLRKKLKEQQKITKQLKKYLAKHKQRQKNYSTQIKSQKHKVRRKQLIIQQISSYKSQSKYLKYYSEQNQKEKMSITNVKAYQISQNDIKDNNYNLGVQIPINKFSISTSNNQKIATFDALGYRAYCIANYIKENMIQITIPQTEQGLKVNVQLNNFGSYEGTIGVQEGQNMAVILKLKDKNNVLSALKKQVYKLTFNIKRNGSYLDIQDKIKHQKQDISYREPNQISQPQSNIRDRIQSFSIQPWGYGYSYLNPKSSHEKDIFSKLQQKRKLIEIEAKQNLEEKKEQPKKEPKKQPINTKGIEDVKIKNSLQPRQSEEQLKKTEVISNESQKRQKKKIKSEPKSSQKEYQSSEEIKMTKREISQIMSIRNGNRNNYKFKKQNEQKKPNIKQMWEKLLIKKKVQDQGLEKQRLKPQPRKSPASRFTSQQRELQPSIVQDKEQSPIKSNLYSVLPGVNRVMTVSRSQKSPHHDHLAPLRTITIEIKNISITQPLAIVSQELGEMAGKFIKLQIKDKIVYYTQIIFNGEFNSILWKLSGCFFHQLTGTQHLDIEIYKTVENKITLLGKTSIRTSKLYFLRNNHIYNGKIMYNKILNGQFTIGFQVQENFPFEVIEEENDQSQTHSLPMPKPLDKKLRIRQSQAFRRSGRINSEQRDESLGSISSSKDNKYTSDRMNNDNLSLRRNSRMQLKETLRRDYNINRKGNKNIQESLEVGVSSLQQSSLMPEGLGLAQPRKSK